ncbi:MAG TPA: thioredoxin family protein [Fulvivirga sp.]|nr:thioredoxin family protein [Fulvivirga sp.]
MSKLKYTFILLLISTFGFAQGIEFRTGNWEEIKAMAKAENKLIFFDAYTSWCGPCKWMDKNTFQDKETGEFYNKNVIAYKQDMEKGEGPVLLKKFGITQFPTYLFIDANENVVHRGSGAKEPEPFIEFAKQALDPKMSLVGLKAQYEDGNREPAFIRQYLYALRDANERSKEIVDWYFNYTSDKELLTAENYEFIKKMAGDPGHPKFAILEQNRSVYEQLVGADEVKKTLSDAYYTYLIMSIYSGKVEKWEQAKTRVKESGFEEADKLIRKASIYYYQQTKQWVDYVTVVDETINKDGMSAGDMGYYALQVANNDDIQGKEQLKLGMDWANGSVKSQSNYRNNYAKAAMLYKMGKSKQALKTAEVALSLATDEEKEKSWTKPTIDLIEKIKSSK